MDLAMPGLGGAEATRRILDASPNARVLVLTASAEESDVLEAVVAGACGYLLKTAGSTSCCPGSRRPRRVTR
jgi:DNA-binding NarL/FixJ family response regulator